MNNCIFSSHARSRLIGGLERFRGFTLIELLVTITVAAILLAVAIPSFRDFIAGQKIKTASYDIMSAMTYVRSEAIKRNDPVVLKQKTGGWVKGWEIYYGADGVNPSLIEHEEFSGVTITNTATSITYGRDGRIASGQSFQIGSSVNAGLPVRCVSIDLSGLPKSKIGSCS